MKDELGWKTMAEFDTIYQLWYYFTFQIPHKWELQQIAFNHSSDIYFKDFTSLCKKYTAKPYSFLVINATLVSDRIYVSERSF